MTRKPVGIALDSQSMEDQLYVVCDDGSVWMAYGAQLERAQWTQIPSVPGTAAAEEEKRER